MNSKTPRDRPNTDEPVMSDGGRSGILWLTAGLEELGAAGDDAETQTRSEHPDSTVAASSMCP